MSNSNRHGFDDIKEVILKSYIRLDLSYNDNVPLINRLVNYIYFISYTEKLHFHKMKKK
ncbi:bacteriocin immunity protein [Clostridium thermobutyricum]|uniref:bacteriocin immunity protein n=1 Tax=Clostridium thermobutyricum TaxID=29372 RepID=UPI001FA8553D|nr:bacteriocin immunity protein [Clostridium thermobutyricum]